MKPVALEELGHPGPDQLLKVEPRTRVWRQLLPGGIPAVIKLYRQRGVRGLVGRGGLVSFRCEREHAALEHLTRHRIPCPEPLFWSHGVSAEHGEWEMLVTREIPGVLNMDDAVIAAETRDPLLLDVPRIFREAGRIHRSGMLHGTLVARNVLLEMKQGVTRSLYFIDIPRAVILPRDIWGSFIAQGDLMELSHSLWCLLRLKPEDLPLYEYGMNDEQRERFIRRYRRYTPTKLQRRIVRLRAMSQRLGAAPAARRLGSSKTLDSHHGG